MRKRSGKRSSKILSIIVFVVIMMLYYWVTGDEGYSNTTGYDEYYSYGDDYNYDFGYSDDYDDSYLTNGAVQQGTYGTSGMDLEISGLRSHFVDTESAESAVMMVYMIGSDLESGNGCASTDIQEMLYASLGEDLKIVIQTGGSSYWYTKGISSKTRQRWLIDESGKLEHLEDVGKGSMVDVNSLSDFISWTAEEYPADRYFLVMWDHGGGTMNGFGYDEVNDNGSLSLVDMADALKDSGVKFDMIGFDACLMATLETAYALEPYADYMVASEEYEPGDGWYYTDFLEAWSDDISMPTEELGQRLIDSFAQYYRNREVTLSLVDLREIPYVCSLLEDFYDSAEVSIQQENTNFKTLSLARSKAREYCNGEIDQVDMLDLVRRTEFEGKDELVRAIQSCVKYYNNSSLTGSHGLAMYFPYSELNSYGSMRMMLKDMGMTESTDFYNYFLSIMAGGQSRNQSTGGIKAESVIDYSSESWYENDAAEFDYGEEYGELYLQETPDNNFELVLDDETWDKITDIQLSVMAYYEDGYLDLGNDNLEMWSDEGNLVLDFDYYWVSIDGNPVAFYADKIYEDTKSTIYSGRTYAILNDETLIEIELEWEPVTDETTEDPEGFVKGYRIVNDAIETEAKGLLTLKKGDKLSFLFDFYSEDGEYIESYEIGDVVAVKSQAELKVSYEELADMDVICWYTLIDI
ncbi:MAG: hypothetical protein IJ379_01600, partial [Lachnospiraceae bacterium]|nr:hypothetical protein [Lachnospiraceae bacterium]